MKKDGENIAEILQKVCKAVGLKEDDGFNLSFSHVYQHVIRSIMHSPMKIDMEVSRDGDAELFGEFLAEGDDDNKLKLIDLALPDKRYGNNSSESLRPFMFNMQRDMIEKVGRYMDEILLYYDVEGQCTMFKKKKAFFLLYDVKISILV